MTTPNWAEALKSPIGTVSPMLPTPHLDHLTEEDYEIIYEPAEDSFALLDALQNDRALLNLHRSVCPLVLEIGSGSGIVSSFIQSSIFDSSVHICTDISEHACSITKATSAKNAERSNSSLDSVRMSLDDGLHIDNIDLIVFNPPYVPTESSEIDTTGGIAATWAGGAEGMDITAVFLSRVARLLAPNGLFYLVTVARNKPASIISQAASTGLQGRSVLERRAGREKLAILRFHRVLT